MSSSNLVFFSAAVGVDFRGAIGSLWYLTAAPQGSCLYSQTDSTEDQATGGGQPSSVVTHPIIDCITPLQCRGIVFLYLSGNYLVKVDRTTD